MAKEIHSEGEQRSIKEMEESDLQDSYQRRTLVDTCPILIDFIKPNMKVLDLGCGTGTITLDVARKVGRGSVTGIDLNEEALRKARTVAEKSGIKNVEFRVGDCYSLEFPDGFFDLVYSNQLLNWTRKPIDALREQARVTRSNGWVIAMISTAELLFLYPDCPELRRFTIACRALKEAPEGRLFSIRLPLSR
jgi:ubiquinone/menaquinone biosynthesis C-methylase UbiE